MTERVPAEFEDFYPALNAWFYVRAFPSADGGLAVYFQDVTERRRARDALAESELRYRFLAESVPEIVWTARPDGSLDYANARLAEYCRSNAIPAKLAQNSDRTETGTSTGTIWSIPKMHGTTKCLAQSSELPTHLTNANSGCGGQTACTAGIWRGACRCSTKQGRW